MKKALLQPTADNTYRISYQDSSGDHNDVICNFSDELRLSHDQEDSGDIEGACNRRYQAFQQLVRLIPDSSETELDWNDRNAQQAMLLVHFSAIDHFLVGDFELCAAMLEMLLELDSEDHLYASKLLAYSYVALGEYELFDEVINDVSDKYPDKVLLTLWSEFRNSGTLLEGELHHLKSHFRAYYDEWIAIEHPVTEEYLTDIEENSPSESSLARELWLQTEHLWTLFPEFINTLRAHTV